MSLYDKWQKQREDIARRAEELADQQTEQRKQAEANAGQRFWVKVSKPARTDEDIREQNRTYRHARRTRIKGNGGRFTPAEWRDLKAFYSFTCLRCKRQEPEIQLTPDHIKPVANGGTSYISNIQPLCLQCNVQKGAKEIDYR